MAKKKRKTRKHIMIKAIIALFLLLAFTLLLVGEGNRADRVCFNGNCFKVEVVDTPEARQKGLMFRDYLPGDEGMLFVFEEEWIYSFWMKNTLIPLDMIWINSGLEVVHIHENAEPCKEDPCPSINPGVPALYVLEVNAGKARETGLSIGDKADFRGNILP